MSNNSPETGYSAVQRAAGLAIILAAAVAGYWRARYGISFSDEGLYLSAPFRYLLGDVPWRDELMTAGRSFDLLIEPLMRIMPHAGSVLAFRWIWYTIHLISLGTLFFVLRRFLSPIFLGLLFAAVVHINVFSVWTPGYDVMHADFMALCLAFWLGGILSGPRRRAAICGAVAAVFFSLAAVCYAPAVVLMAVPTGYAAWSMVKKRAGSPGFACAAAFLPVAVLCLAAFVFWFILKPGLLHDYMNAAAALGGAYRGNNPLFGRLGYAMLFLIRIPKKCALIHIAFLGALYAAHRLQFRPGGQVKTLPGAAVLLAPVAYFFFMLLTFSPAEHIAGLCVAAIVLFIVSYRKATGGERFSAVAAALLAWGTLWYWAIGFVSVGHFITASCSAAPLVILLGMLLRLQFEETGVRAAAITAAATVLAIVMSITVLTFNHVYLDGTGLSGGNKKLRQTKLRGILTGSCRVRTLEDLAGYLDQRMKPGSFLLAYDEIPMIYYLTGTRPALNAVWQTKHWPVDVRKASVEYMIKNRRIPEYAVRFVSSHCNCKYYGNAPLSGNLVEQLAGNPAVVEPPPVYSNDPAVDPVNAFVMKNYGMEKRFGPFEVWRLKPGGAGVRQ